MNKKEENYIRKKTCDGKYKHKSMISAEYQLQKTPRSENVEIYKCPFCKYLHIGHSRKKKRNKPKKNKKNMLHESWKEKLEKATSERCSENLMLSPRISNAMIGASEFQNRAIEELERILLVPIDTNKLENGNQVSQIITILKSLNAERFSK